MGNITISIKRFEELLYKESAYELKRKDLKQAGFVSAVDRLLFQCPEEPADGEDEAADDDF